jgi:putative redox protein
MYLKSSEMATAIVEYLGGLRTKSTHQKSGTVIFTDAPVDNNGTGEAFSPTDLLATAYISCMLTIVGIYCEKNTIAFEGATGEVTKIMGSGPRRVERLEISLDFSANTWSEETKKLIMRAGESCPVALSVSDDMEVDLQYKF